MPYPVTFFPVDVSFYCFLAGEFPHVSDCNGMVLVMVLKDLAGPVSQL